MKISFIGHGSMLVNIANMFKQKGFHINGLYNDDLKLAIDMAISLDIRAYYDLEKIVEESEVIFLYDKDDNIKNLSYRVLNYNLSDKIICVISKSFMSYDFDMFDTCFTVFPVKDFVDDEIYDLKDTKFIIEGNGKKCSDFIYELNDSGINYELVDRDRKNAYMFSIECGTELMDGYISLMFDYLNKAGILDKIPFEKLIRENVDNYFKSPKNISYFDKTLSNMNVKDIDLHFDAIEKYGNVNIKALYKVLAYSIIEHENYSKSEKERIRRIIYNK